MWAQEQQRRRLLASTPELAHPPWFPQQESPRPERGRGLLEQQELGSQAWPRKLARLTWIQRRGQQQVFQALTVQRVSRPGVEQEQLLILTHNELARCWTETVKKRHTSSELLSRRRRLGLRSRGRSRSILSSGSSLSRLRVCWLVCWFVCSRSWGRSSRSSGIGCAILLLLNGILLLLAKHGLKALLQLRKRIGSLGRLERWS